MRSGPLNGVRIVEFAGLGPAPFVAMLLSDKIGTELRGPIAPPSPEAESLRKQLQQTLHKS